MSEIISGNSHLGVEFVLENTDEVHIFVDASAPVYAYVMDTESLEEYEAGMGIVSFGGSHERRRHDRVIVVDDPGDYWLVIINNQDAPVAVYYEVAVP